MLVELQLKLISVCMQTIAGTSEHTLKYCWGKGAKLLEYAMGCVTDSSQQLPLVTAANLLEFLYALDHQTLGEPTLIQELSCTVCMFGALQRVPRQAV